MTKKLNKKKIMKAVRLVSVITLLGFLEACKTVSQGGGIGSQGGGGACRG